MAPFIRPVPRSTKATLENGDEQLHVMTMGSITNQFAVAWLGLGPEPDPHFARSIILQDEASAERIYLQTSYQANPPAHTMLSILQWWEGKKGGGCWSVRRP
jgi:hypothetical protein